MRRRSYPRPSWWSRLCWCRTCCGSSTSRYPSARTIASWMHDPAFPHLAWAGSPRACDLAAPPKRDTPYRTHAHAVNIGLLGSSCSWLDESIHDHTSIYLHLIDLHRTSAMSLWRMYARATPTRVGEWERGTEDESLSLLCVCVICPLSTPQSKQRRAPAPTLNRAIQAPRRP